MQPRDMGAGMTTVRRFPIEYIAEHEWFSVLCPAFNGEQYQLRQCICGAQRWLDDDGFEHQMPGYVPHPIRQALDDPAWLALLAITMDQACPVTGWPE
jgi:hypothetical protein